MEASKIRATFNEKTNKMEALAERLEKIAGDTFQPTEDGLVFLSHVSSAIYPRLDSFPEHIENIYEELEEESTIGPILAKLSKRDAGWLARYIRDSTIKDRERIADEIQNELTASYSFFSLLRNAH